MKSSTSFLSVLFVIFPFNGNRCAPLPLLFFVTGLGRSLGNWLPSYWVVVVVVEENSQCVCVCVYVILECSVWRRWNETHLNGGNEGKMMKKKKKKKHTYCHWQSNNWKDTSHKWWRRRCCLCHHLCTHWTLLRQLPTIVCWFSFSQVFRVSGSSNCLILWAGRLFVFVYPISVFFSLSLFCLSINSVLKDDSHCCCCCRPDQPFRCVSSN